MKALINLIIILFFGCISFSQIGDDFEQISIQYEKINEIDSIALKNQFKNSSRETIEFYSELLNRKLKFNLFLYKNRSLFKQEEHLRNKSNLSTNQGNVSYDNTAWDLYIDIIKEKLLMVKNSENKYAIEDSLKGIDWDIKYEETDNILGLNAIKATATGIEKNTVLEAWFAPEIKLSQGPYIYWGLPGLILKVKQIRLEDSDLGSIIKSVSYNAVKISQLKNGKKVVPKLGKKEILSKEEWSNRQSNYESKLKEMNSQKVDTSE